MEKTLINRFCDKILRLSARWDEDVRRTLPILAPDLSPATVRTLQAVAGRPGGDLTDLAANLKITIGSACPLVQHLVELGLIDRKIPPANRRETNLYLTAQGKKVVTSLETARQKYWKKVLAPLSEADVESLVGHLETLTVSKNDS